MKIAINHIDQMVLINAKNISYSNLRMMYNNGNGHGLQTSAELESKRDAITAICSEISKKIYELDDMLKN
jgi:hypothetical protein